jgi:hypothetical protein
MATLDPCGRSSEILPPWHSRRDFSQYKEDPSCYFTLRETDKNTSNRPKNVTINPNASSSPDDSAQQGTTCSTQSYDRGKDTQHTQVTGTRDDSGKQHVSRQTTRRAEDSGEKKRNTSRQKTVTLEGNSERKKKSIELSINSRTEGDSYRSDSTLPDTQDSDTSRKDSTTPCKSGRRKSTRRKSTRRKSTCPIIKTDGPKEDEYEISGFIPQRERSYSDSVSLRKSFAHSHKDSFSDHQVLGHARKAESSSCSAQFRADVSSSGSSSSVTSRAGVRWGADSRKCPHHPNQSVDGDHCRKCHHKTKVSWANSSQTHYTIVKLVKYSHPPLPYIF